MTKVPVLKNKQVKLWFVICFPTEYLEVVKNSRKRARALRIDLELGKVGFWREGKTGTPREKPLGKEENQQQTYPFIYLKHEKGTPFGRSLAIKAIIGSTHSPSHPPGKGGKCPHHCATLAQFSSEADSVVVSTQKS